MRKISFIVLFALLSTCCFAQTVQNGCGDFKTGKFAFRDSARHIIEVTRKNNKQREYDKDARITTKFRIKWISSCEYELTQIWSNSKARRKRNKTVNRIVITKANGNASYEYSCGCRDRVIEGSVGTMVRLEE